MDPGLQTSMWARIPSSRRPYDPARHDARSRSLPPPISLAAAPATPTSTPTSTPGPHTTTTTTTTTPTMSGAKSSTATQAGSLSRLKSFRRFEQACRRVRWKCIDLENSYNRALAPADWDFAVADAEVNFKVDFHEFYAWIEQAVVLVLLVFGASVERGSSGWHGAWSWSAGHRSSHAYHHNVLKALEEQGNPLNGVLGSGDVCQALWEAKKLRNRWKDASEGKDTPPLKMYNLHWIVSQILDGLTAAYALAKEEVGSDLETAEDDATVVEDGWEWMVDGMDWEP